MPSDSYVALVRAVGADRCVTYPDGIGDSRLTNAVAKLAALRDARLL